MSDPNFEKVVTASGNVRPKKRVTSLWLTTYPEEHIYNCPDCRFSMFSYRGEVVSEIAGPAPMKLPISILCKNPNCGRVVRIEGFAHPSQ